MGLAKWTVWLSALLGAVLVLSGCGNGQTGEAAQICKFEKKLAFYLCVEEKFPIGSNFDTLKQFLLDSGFEHHQDGNNHSFSRSAVDLTSIKIWFNVKEVDAAIAEFDGLRSFQQIG